MDGFKTISMRFTSRASVKIHDNYYTFEATIEKQCPENYTDDEYEQAKVDLWTEANNEVDTQINDVVEMLKKRK